MMRLDIISVMLALLLLSCGKKEKNDYKLLDVNPDKIVSLNKIREFALQEDQYILGNISQWNNYITQEGDIFIVDQKNRNVVQYDAYGRFVGIVGKKGHGPGEYSRPLRVSVDESGKVFVACTERGYEVVYDKENRFISEFKVHDGKLYPGGIRFGAGVKVVCAYVFSDNLRYKGIDLFHVFNDNNKLERRIRMDYPEIYEKLDLAEGLYPHWFVKNNLIYIAFFPLSRIYVYDLTGKLLKVLSFMPESFKLKKEKRRTSRQKLSIIREMSRGSKTHSIQDLGEDFIFYSYYNEDLPENFKIYDLWSYRTYFFEIIDERGERLTVENHVLPGGPLAFSSGKTIYLLLNDSPDSRKIGVYEIEINKTK